MTDDLLALALRVEAGKNRTRQGHDLRAWYETETVVDGADSMIVQRTTHAAPRDVVSGYIRLPWATICREVAKLSVSILDGALLELGTDASTAEQRARSRWRKLVTPKGLES